MNIKTSMKAKHCRGKRVRKGVWFCFGVGLAVVGDIEFVVVGDD